MQGPKPLPNGVWRPYDRAGRCMPRTFELAMPQDSPRVRIDALDWANALPITRLLGAFRVAIAPAKMAPAVLLVVLMFLVGHGLDLMWGEPVVEGEFDRYLRDTPAEFEAWRGEQIAKRYGTETRGIFAAALESELDAFQGFLGSAIRLDFGLDTIIDRQPVPEGVLGSLWIMVLGVPGWLLSTYPFFTGVLLLVGFLVLCALGGFIARLAAVECCTGERGKIGEAASFVGRRYVWFFLCPVIPLAVALLLGLVLMLAGLVLFNLPGLDVAGALLLGLMLRIGSALAVIFPGLLCGGNRPFSALAVEGSDAFDAISRAYNYALGRPLRFVVYTAGVILYGAATYVLVGLVVFLTLWMTRRFLGVWAFAEVEPGTTRLEAMLPSPRVGRPHATADFGALQQSAWGTAAAGIITAWVQLLLAVLPAYALSYYFSAQTWVYLLLRRAADGTDYHEHDQDPGRGEDAPDKVEAATESA